MCILSRAVAVCLILVGIAPAQETAAVPRSHLEQRLLAALEQDDVDLRIAAIRILGYFGRAEQVDPLITRSGACS